ncbi:MAG: pyridoxamine 5'-phosphate oxidase family protein [bacterium]|nr:pyridoxamine 5'-phosphate oxidase [Gammaproteobacteria bacterium]HIL95586.1 pyridoxamine 5'-phosphate oxidase [Pseudomonadales bacterium]
MSLAMTKTERDAFLADCHVGVVSINRQSEGPLSAPIWYMYEDGLVLFSTGGDSRKGKLMTLGERISMVVQTETAPYQYVSIEGPIVARQPADVDRDVLPMAIRYLGDKMGTAYAKGSSGEGSVLIKMKPEKWLSVDYNKG